MRVLLAFHLMMWSKLSKKKKNLNCILQEEMLEGNKYNSFFFFFLMSKPNAI